MDRSWPKPALEDCCHRPASRCALSACACCNSAYIRKTPGHELTSCRGGAGCRGPEGSTPGGGVQAPGVCRSCSCCEELCAGCHRAVCASGHRPPEQGQRVGAQLLAQHCRVGLSGCPEAKVWSLCRQNKAGPQQPHTRTVAPDWQPWKLLQAVHLLHGVRSSLWALCCESCCVRPAWPHWRHNGLCRAPGHACSMSHLSEAASLLSDLGSLLSGGLFIQGYFRMQASCSC